jgi:hypothetical protein
MPKLKPEDEQKRKKERVEVRIEPALLERMRRVCAAKAITVSHVMRKGLEWAIPMIERDPNIGTPEELTRRASRPELKPWEPGRPVRSREPF